MSLSVIIPSRTASNLGPCVEAVRTYDTCNVIIVDDGVDWGTIDASAGWAMSMTGAKIVDAPKPFIFSRNINLGIAEAGQDDVVLLNDDAILKTFEGFSVMQQACMEHPEYGLIAATTNSVGNLNQLPKGIGLREDPVMVCFVCVFIPRATINRVGLLDERFIAYGGDDNAYCMEVRRAGLKIGIHDGCFVDHKHLPSTFRGRGGGDIKQGQEIYKSIYGEDYSGRPCK